MLIKSRKYHFQTQKFWQGMRLPATMEVLPTNLIGGACVRIQPSLLESILLPPLSSTLKEKTQITLKGHHMGGHHMGEHHMGEHHMGEHHMGEHHMGEQHTGEHHSMVLSKYIICIYSED